ncbi:hypothetical protein JTE90_000999 [Oedothorax gibbosus]|uniref:Reverse transcriptase domain-containing protein n=1 Tax=Oedothorax gibbosus TaxID=931172 RepID=A0AAV6TR16_9ARAC|nr:hypothetical protein JTE90_000999 [Oedothorax gibbosus]
MAGAIYSAIRAIGLPYEFQDYIKNLYEDSTTTFCHPGATEQSFHPTCGVRQGDPLSPLLFNAVIEFLIRRVKSFIGVDVDGVLMNVSAFADDLLFFASTQWGLQRQVNTAVEFLARCNLRVNTAKSMTISIMIDGKNKRVKIVDPMICVGGIPVRSLKPGEQFRYLGVFFRPDGLLSYDPVAQISDWLSRLASAPLKPQQRLFLLRHLILPKISHVSVLSRIRIGVLEKTDRVVRAFLRKHLDLPHDALNAFFHASIGEGGLGVPSLRVSVPELRVKRLKAIRKSLSVSASNSSINDFLHKHLERAIGVTISGTPKSFWSQKLMQSIDGAGLAESWKTPGQNAWMHGRNLFLNGRDFINSVKLKFNALPARSRCARGRPEKDRLCRAGCHRNEDLAHILQVCQRTQGMRISETTAKATGLEKSAGKEDPVELDTSLIL